MTKFAALIASVCLVPSVSHGAETAFGTLEPYGEFSVHQLSGGGFSESYWSGDFGVRFDASANALPVDLGFYAGYEGLGVFEAGNNFNFGTAAVVVKSGAHELSFGLPRSVFSDVFDREERIGNVLFDFEVELFTDSVRYIRLLGSQIGISPDLLGVRYDTGWGATSLSAGLFWGEWDLRPFLPSDEVDLGDFESLQAKVIQVAIDHEIGDLRFWAGFEHSEYILSTSSNSYLLGVSATRGKLSYGLDANLRKDDGFQTGHVDLFGTFQFNDRLRAGVSHVIFLDGDSSSSFSSVGVEFSPRPSSFVRVMSMLERSDLGGSIAVYEATVGLRF
jgi:hypothetical protein